MADRSRFCTPAQEVPTARGAYVILITLAERLKVRLGDRAPMLLPAGRYLYCGSARGPGGLRARLGRHMRRGKAVRWHVDRLTEAGDVRGAWIFPGGDECALVRRLSHLPVPIAGFGSSDCAACRSHLLRWPEAVALPWESRPFRPRPRATGRADARCRAACLSRSPSVR